MTFLLASFASASIDFIRGCYGDACNPIAVNECGDFYDDSRHYTISVWEYDQNASALLFKEWGGHYRYYKIDLDYDAWNSNRYIGSVLVTSGNETLSLEGGFSGTIGDDAETVIFCGYRLTGSNSNGGIAAQAAGVPEFSTVALIIAVVSVTAGLVLMRRN